MVLYPLKFHPLLKEVLWGGDRLAKSGKRVPKGKNPAEIGESWELSGVADDESVVAFGTLADNTLSELIEVYMGELVGDAVYEKYGLEFPVLLKFIDTREKLSIQVHPSHEFAQEMHSARGKSEMWYIVDAKEGAAIYLDFKHPLSEEEYDKAVEGIVAMLSEKNITITELEIKMLVEEVCADFNEAVDREIKEVDAE